VSYLREVRELADSAIDLCRGTPEAEELTALADRLQSPLRVAIAGRVKAGKSTLLNALVGEQLAPTDAGECTKIVTWYQHGPTYRIAVHLDDGTSQPGRFHRDAGAIEVDLGSLPATAVERIVVEWPSPRLADLTLIDTPGMASTNEEISDRAVSFLSPKDEQPTEADAIIYLMRHLHSTDLSFLEAFHDDELAHASPVNAIGVLSRADEIGVGRNDAMGAAQRIAGRYRVDEKLRRYCQTVLPMAGLLAETAATLTEDEFRALSRIAAVERKEVDAQLLSADRFVSADPTTGPTPLERRHLLDRLGVFGVRISLPLIRLGRVTSASELAEALQSRSGIHQLRSELIERFGNRRDVLRARSVLQGVEAVLGQYEGEGASELLGELERLRASSHEFAEIRLLNDLRRGFIAFPAGLEGDVERILGGSGTKPPDRVGLEPEAPEDEVRAALLEAIDRWRTVQAHPLTSREVSNAAGVLVRTCEGALAELALPRYVPVA
jgi:hypothetical protein